MVHADVFITELSLSNYIIAIYQLTMLMTATWCLNEDFFFLHRQWQNLVDASP